jgi:hypothetical protein
LMAYPLFLGNMQFCKCNLAKQDMVFPTVCIAKCIKVELQNTYPSELAMYIYKNI